MTEAAEMRYARRDDVAVELLPDGALAFQATDCRLIRLSRTAWEFWDLLDGNRTVDEIAGTLADRYALPGAKLRGDLAEAVTMLEKERLIKRRARSDAVERSDEMSAVPRYLANPDVLCRIEDDTGAILYNPDTDAVQVVNPVGLEIWQTLSTPCDVGTIIARLQEVCEGVPADRVAADVGEFLKTLGAAGFVGETEA